MNSRWLDRKLVTFSAFVKENQGATVQGGANKRGRRSACASPDRRLGCKLQSQRLQPNHNSSIAIHLQVFPYYFLHQNEQVADIQDEDISRTNQSLFFACHFIGRPPSNTHPQPVSILSSSTRVPPSRFCRLPTLPFASSSTLLHVVKAKAISNRARNDSGTPIKSGPIPFPWHPPSFTHLIRSSSKSWVHTRLPYC